MSIDQHHPLVVTDSPEEVSSLITSTTHTQSAKIIPLRIDRWSHVEALTPSVRADHGRHFLKVTLPSIPVAVFTLAFLLSYCLEATNATHAGRPIDPAPALLGSLAITAVISALCISIYSGFRHVAGLDEE
jgi:hypothetical protein